MAKDFTIDPETGEVRYHPSAVSVFRKLNDKQLVEFFKKAAEQESDPDFKTIYNDFNRLRRDIAMYVKKNYTK